MALSFNVAAQSQNGSYVTLFLATFKNPLTGLKRLEAPFCPCCLSVTFVGE